MDLNIMPILKNKTGHSIISIQRDMDLSIV